VAQADTMASDGEQRPCGQSRFSKRDGGADVLTRCRIKFIVHAQKHHTWPRLTRGKKELREVQVLGEDDVLMLARPSNQFGVRALPGPTVLQ